MPGCTCQRAKSPRQVREKVPAPKPPTGAPCQKPSSMWPPSSEVFFVPGFSSGLPMGRFHAAFGISSLAGSAAAETKSAHTARSPRRGNIKPPDKAWGSPKAAPECNSEQLSHTTTITIFYASKNGRAIGAKALCDQMLVKAEAQFLFEIFLHL